MEEEQLEAEICGLQHLVTETKTGLAERLDKLGRPPLHLIKFRKIFPI
jgi:hypothetical protein